MTGKERILAAIRGKESDRVPVFPLAHYFTASVTGISVKDFATDADRMASALLAGYERFGWDGIQPGSDVAVEAEALGSELNYPEDAPPYVVRPALEDPARLAQLKPPNPLRDGRMPIIVGATRICAREAGKDAFIGPFMMGPLNCASQIRGVENLMTDILDRPEFVDALFDFCTAFLIDFGKALIDAGADAVFLGEALCSPRMISPRFYAGTVVPRQQRLICALKEYAPVRIALHVCGNVTKIMPAMIETGADILDLDWAVDMGAAKRMCARRVAIRGNIDPATVLLQGTPELVYAKSREVIEAAGAGGGLILGSGCDVALGTPHTNMHAMVTAAIEIQPGGLRRGGCSRA